MDKEGVSGYTTTRGYMIRSERRFFTGGSYSNFCYSELVSLDDSKDGSAKYYGKVTLGFFFCSSTLIDTTGFFSSISG